MGKKYGIFLTILFFAIICSKVFAEEQKHIGGVELLFVQNSKSVKFDKNTMILKDVRPSTTFFPTGRKE